MVVTVKSENIEVSGEDFKSTEPIKAYSTLYHSSCEEWNLNESFYVRVGRSENNAYLFLDVPPKTVQGVHVEVKMPSLSPVYCRYSIEVFIDDLKGNKGKIEDLRQALLFAAEKLKIDN